MAGQRERPLEARIIAGLFLLAIVLPLAGTLPGGRAAVSVAEQRVLAPSPSLSSLAQDWTRLPATLGAWFDDHFGGRELLVRLNRRLTGWVRHGALSGAPVIEGRDGWLFFTGDRSLEDHQGRLPFTAAELAAWTFVLEEKQRRLSALGIPWLFVIVPNKQSVYPEFLPDWLAGARGDTRADQLVRHLTRHTGVPVLDLRPGLLQYKESGPLYRRHDTHWNQRGADAGRQLLLATLARIAPDLALAEAGTGPWREREVRGGDLARMLGRTQAREVVPRRRSGMARCRSDAAAGDRRATGAGSTITDDCTNHGPVALVFRDSFMIALRPLLTPHFRRAVYVWQRPDPCRLEQLAREHRPGVIIEQITERFLVLPPPACPARVN